MIREGLQLPRKQRRTTRIGSGRGAMTTTTTRRSAIEDAAAASSSFTVFSLSLSCCFVICLVSFPSREGSGLDRVMPLAWRGACRELGKRASQRAKERRREKKRRCEREEASFFSLLLLSSYLFRIEKVFKWGKEKALFPFYPQAAFSPPLFLSLCQHTRTSAHAAQHNKKNKKKNTNNAY